ncbi:hypothetical protein DRB96_32000 [Streptomyces sp. ICC1]|nr:hypothetical protein DRB89_31365 [Streptomyces sp. ICC4]AWZ16107.1 hypothetical protein DRB96_32000 [Streptomyces sp. ICC1]
MAAGPAPRGRPGGGGPGRGPGERPGQDPAAQPTEPAVQELVGAQLRLDAVEDHPFLPGELGSVHRAAPPARVRRVPDRPGPRRRTRRRRGPAGWSRG